MDLNINLILNRKQLTCGHDVMPQTYMYILPKWKFQNEK